MFIVAVDLRVPFTYQLFSEPAVRRECLADRIVNAQHPPILSIHLDDRDSLAVRVNCRRCRLFRRVQR